MIQFANPAALWFLALIVPIVLLYLLKRRRQDRIVPSVMLWKQALEDTQAYTPFQKLRSNLLLLLQILAVVLLTALLAQPYFPTTSRQTQQWILVLDRSASMYSKDERPTRFDVARQKLRDAISAMGRADEGMLVSVGAEASILQNFTLDHASLRTKLMDLQPEHVPCDWEQLVLVLKPLMKRSQKPKILIASDFANFPSSTMEVLPFDALNVGHETANIGITRAAIEPLQETTQEQLIFFEIKNFSNANQSAEVKIEQNQELLDAFDLSLKPLEQTAKTIRVMVPSTSRFKISIQPDDSFVLDNDFILIAAKREKIRVASEIDNPFLQRALKVLPAVALSPNAPVRISNRLQQGPGVYFVSGDIPGPAPIVQWDSAAASLRFVDAGLWRISNYGLLETPASGRGLLETARGTVGYTIDQNGTRQVVLGFEIANSNLPLLAGFPIFLGNALEWIQKGIYPDKPSITSASHRIEGEIDGGKSYVNFANAAESDLTPAKVQATSASTTKAAVLRQDFSVWLLLALVAVVILEWWVFHRKQSV